MKISTLFCAFFLINEACLIQCSKTATFTSLFIKRKDYSRFVEFTVFFSIQGTSKPYTTFSPLPSNPEPCEKTECTIQVDKSKFNADIQITATFNDGCLWWQTGCKSLGDATFTLFKDQRKLEVTNVMFQYLSQSEFRLHWRFPASEVFYEARLRVGKTTRQLPELGESQKFTYDELSIAIGDTPATFVFKLLDNEQTELNSFSKAWSPGEPLTSSVTCVYEAAGQFELRWSTPPDNTYQRILLAVNYVDADHSDVDIYGAFKGSSTRLNSITLKSSDGPSSGSEWSVDRISVNTNKSLELKIEITLFFGVNQDDVFYTKYKTVTKQYTPLLVDDLKPTNVACDVMEREKYMQISWSKPKDLTNQHVDKTKLEIEYYSVVTNRRIDSTSVELTDVQALQESIKWTPKAMKVNSYFRIQIHYEYKKKILAQVTADKACYVSPTCANKPTIKEASNYLKIDWKYERSSKLDAQYIFMHCNKEQKNIKETSVNERTFQLAKNSEHLPPNNICQFSIQSRYESFSCDGSISSDKYYTPPKPVQSLKIEQDSTDLHKIKLSWKLPDSSNFGIVKNIVCKDKNSLNKNWSNSIGNKEASAAVFTEITSGISIECTVTTESSTKKKKLASALQSLQMKPESVKNLKIQIDSYEQASFTWDYEQNSFRDTQKLIIKEIATEKEIYTRSMSRDSKEDTMKKLSAGVCYSITLTAFSSEIPSNPLTKKFNAKIYCAQNIRVKESIATWNEIRGHLDNLKIKLVQLLPTEKKIFEKTIESQDTSYKLPELENGALFEFTIVTMACVDNCKNSLKFCTNPDEPLDTKANAINESSINISWKSLNSKFTKIRIAKSENSDQDSLLCPKSTFIDPLKNPHTFDKLRTGSKYWICVSSVTTFENIQNCQSSKILTQYTYPNLNCDQLSNEENSDFSAKTNIIYHEKLGFKGNVFLKANFICDSKVTDNQQKYLNKYFQNSQCKFEEFRSINNKKDNKNTYAFQLINGIPYNFVFQKKINDTNVPLLSKDACPISVVLNPHSIDKRDFQYCSSSSSLDFEIPKLPKNHGFADYININLFNINGEKISEKQLEIGDKTINVGFQGLSSNSDQYNVTFQTFAEQKNGKILKSNLKSYDVYALSAISNLNLTQPADKFNQILCKWSKPNTNFSNNENRNILYQLTVRGEDDIIIVEKNLTWNEVFTRKSILIENQKILPDKNMKVKVKLLSLDKQTNCEYPVEKKIKLESSTNVKIVEEEIIQDIMNISETELKILKLDTTKQFAVKIPKKAFNEANGQIRGLSLILTKILKTSISSNYSKSRNSTQSHKWSGFNLYSNKSEVKELVMFPPPKKQENVGVEFSHQFLGAQSRALTDDLNANQCSNQMNWTEFQTTNNSIFIVGNHSIDHCRSSANINSSCYGDCNVFLDEASTYKVEIAVYTSNGQTKFYINEKTTDAVHSPAHLTLFFLLLILIIIIPIGFVTKLFIEAKLFYDFLRNFNQKTSEEISTEFQITDLIDESKKTTGHNFQELNRYENILPYQESMAITDRIFYFNGNIVDLSVSADPSFQTLSNKYIACQAPTKKSFVHHWSIIYEQNVSIILVLSNFIEEGLEKMVPYWPMNTHAPANCINFNMELDQISISSSSQSQLNQSDEQNQPSQITVTLIEKSDDDHEYCVYDLLVKCGPQTQQHQKKVKLIHFLCWPDRGIPKTPQSIDQFTKLWEMYRRLSQHAFDNDQKVMIHCSAGIGRTGTMILFELVMTLIEKRLYKAVNMGNLLWEIRKYRPYFVQTPIQYHFVYQMVKREIKKMAEKKLHFRLFRPNFTQRSEDYEMDVIYDSAN